MSVGILVITHGQVGHALIDAACNTLGTCPLPVELLSITPKNSDTSSLQEQSETLHAQLQGKDGVIVLTDIYGATPANIGQQLLHHPDTLMISGMNLPMLIRIMNYPDLPLHELAEKAVTGTRDGAFITERSES